MDRDRKVLKSSNASRAPLPCIKISSTGGIFPALTTSSCDCILCRRIPHTLRTHSQGHSQNTAHSSAGATMAEDHSLGGLNRRHILSRCFQDQKSEIRHNHLLQTPGKGSVPASLLVFQVSSPCVPSSSPFHKDTVTLD